MHHTFDTVLFDLDGTLTDPKEGITKSVAYALEAFGIHEHPDKLTAFIGPPLIESFMVYYNMDREQAQKAVEKYRERFASTGIFENVLYSDTKEVLESLRAHGKRLALATSKPTVYAEQILEHFGIRAYFENVTGSFLDGRRVRKHEVIEAALNALGCQNARDKAAMVGDRLHDIEGAKAAGIYSIGVLCGYGSREELVRAGADIVVSGLKAVQSVIL